MTASLAVAIALLAAQPGSSTIRLPIVDASDLRFVHLSATHGMAATRVRQVMQDDLGFIWFGSEFGLNRFDGYEYQFITHDASRQDTLGVRISTVCSRTGRD